MSQRHMCSSCKVGRIKSFYFSIEQAIVICDNLECDSYLNKWPWESIVTNPISGVGKFAKYERALSYSSGINSDCDGAVLSPAASQCSLADKEVELLLSRSHYPSGDGSHLKLSRAKTPPTYPNAKEHPLDALYAASDNQSSINKDDGDCFDSLNEITFENLISYPPKLNRNSSLCTDGAQDLDLWLQEIEHSPCPIGSLTYNEKRSTPQKISSPIVSPLKTLIPSSGSAFSQVSPTKLSTPGKLSVNSTNKVMRELSFDSTVLSTCKGNRDVLTLVDSNFLSPASSGISEDSGFTDEDNLNKLSKQLSTEQTSCAKLRDVEGQCINLFSSHFKSNLSHSPLNCSKLKYAKSNISISNLFNLLSLRIPNEIDSAESSVARNDNFPISGKSQSPSLNKNDLLSSTSSKGTDESSYFNASLRCATSSHEEDISPITHSSPCNPSNDQDPTSVCNATCDAHLNSPSISNISVDNSSLKDGVTCSAKIANNNVAHSTLSSEKDESAIHAAAANCISLSQSYSSSGTPVSITEKDPSIPSIEAAVDDISYIDPLKESNLVAHTTELTSKTPCLTHEDIFQPTSCNILKEIEEKSPTISDLLLLVSPDNPFKEGDVLVYPRPRLEGTPNPLSYVNVQSDACLNGAERCVTSSSAQADCGLKHLDQLARLDETEYLLTSSSKQTNGNLKEFEHPSFSPVFCAAESSAALGYGTAASPNSLHDLSRCKSLEETGIVVQSDEHIQNVNTCDSLSEPSTSKVCHDASNSESFKIQEDQMQIANDLYGKENSDEDCNQSLDNVIISYLDDSGKTCLLNTLDQDSSHIDGESKFSRGLEISEFVPPPENESCFNSSDSFEESQKICSYSHRSLTKFKNQFDKDRWSIAELYLDELDIEVVFKNSQSHSNPQNKDDSSCNLSNNDASSEASFLKNCKNEKEGNLPRCLSAPSSLPPILKSACDNNARTSLQEAADSQRSFSATSCLPKKRLKAKLRSRKSKRVCSQVPNISPSTENSPDSRVEVMNVFKPIKLIPQVAQEPFVTKDVTSFVSPPISDEWRHSVGFTAADDSGSEVVRSKNRPTIVGYVNGASSNFDLDEAFFNGIKSDGNKSDYSPSDDDIANRVSLEYLLSDCDSSDSFEEVTHHHLFANKIKKGKEGSSKPSKMKSLKANNTNARCDPRGKPRVYHRRLPVITVCKNDEIMVEDMDVATFESKGSDSRRSTGKSCKFKNNGYLKSCNTRSSKLLRQSDSKLFNGSLHQADSSSNRKIDIKNINKDSSFLKAKWMQNNFFSDSHTLVPLSSSYDDVTFDSNLLFNSIMKNDFGALSLQSICHRSQSNYGSSSESVINKCLSFEEMNTKHSSLSVSSRSNSPITSCEERDILDDEMHAHSPASLNLDNEYTRTKGTSTPEAVVKALDPSLPQHTDASKDHNINLSSHKYQQIPAFETLQSNLAKCSSETDILKVLRESGWILSSCNPNIDYSPPVNSRSPTIIPLPLKDRYSQIASDVIMWSPISKEDVLNECNTSTSQTIIPTSGSNKLMSDRHDKISLTGTKKKLHFSSSHLIDQSKGNEISYLKIKNNPIKKGVKKRVTSSLLTLNPMSPKKRSPKRAADGYCQNLSRINIAQSPASVNLNFPLKYGNNFFKPVSPLPSDACGIIPAKREASTSMTNDTYTIPSVNVSSYRNSEIHSKASSSLEIKTESGNDRVIDFAIKNASPSEMKVDVTSENHSRVIGISPNEASCEKFARPSLTTISVESGSSFLRPSPGLKRMIAEMQSENLSFLKKEDEDETLIELPDDFVAYEQISKEGRYAIEPPKLPVAPPLIPWCMRQQFKVIQELSNSPKKRKLDGREQPKHRKKRKLKNAKQHKKEEEHMPISMEETLRLKAESTLEEMVSQRGSNQIPSMICMCFGGKMYVYHRGET